jgi:exodeoxyribonuclease V alpha subunit
MILSGKITKLNRSKTEGILEIQNEGIKQQIKFKITNNNIKPLFLHAYYRFNGSFADRIFLVDDIRGAVQEIREEDITEIFPSMTKEDIDILRENLEIQRLGDFLSIPEEKLIATAHLLLGEQKAQVFVSGINNIKKRQDYIDVWELINKTNPVIDLSTVVKIVNALRRRASINETSVYALLKYNPWLLLQTEAFDTAGEAYKVANNIASYLGYSEKDSKAILSCAIAQTHIYTQNGHSYIPYYSLVNRVAGMMKISRDEVKEILNSGAKDNRSGYLIRYNAFSQELEKEYVEAVSQEESETTAQYVGHSVYLPRIHFMEKYAAQKLAQILKTPSVINKGKYLEVFIRRNNTLLTNEQKEAVLSIPENRITVITGGAGTGKTTAIKIIKEVLEGAGYQPVVLAPTGIASQRIAPGEGSTIHRYAHIFAEEDIVFDSIEETTVKEQEERGKTGSEVIIVDEMSMITVPVFAKLLAATADAIAYVFVGDPNQLPPIGPGGVFQALIDLGNSNLKNIKTIHLSKVFRATNSILTHAENIIEGRELFEDENLKIIEAANWKEISAKVVELIKKLLASGVSYEDIMILSDKRGEGKSGTSLLNQVIREQVFDIKGDKYSEGDVVIATRNDYNSGAFFKNRVIERYIRDIRHKERPTIFNGTVGVIKEIDEEKVIIEYKNPSIEAHYNPEELDWYIEHGFAITVHKAQGGQAKHVIFAVAEPEKLSREMLYTALTRSQDKVYLIGGTRESWRVCRKSQYVLSKLKYRILQELQDETHESERLVGSRVNLIE